MEFTYLGGDEMERAAGCPPVVHYREMAFMGFADVLRNLGKVRRNLGAAIRAMERTRPDAVVLVDYPSFNLRLARHAFSMGIPVYYFIAPKVWAWKNGVCGSCAATAAKCFRYSRSRPTSSAATA